MTTLQTLAPHTKDLGGGFTVRRLLPSADRRSVGPFVFFDHFGPIERRGPAGNHDVRPHPHIGLATLTYLFDGAMMHRDSTGVVQRIEPGAVNWMSAGRGIVHSERTARRTCSAHLPQPRPAALGRRCPRPTRSRRRRSSTRRRRASRRCGSTARTVHVVVGSAFGAASPIETSSPTLALVFDFDVASGTSVELPALASERALYAVDHPFEIDGEKVDEFTMASCPPARRRSWRRRAAAGWRWSAASRSATASSPGTSSPAGASGSSRRGRLGGAALRAHPRRDRVHSAAGASPLSRRPAGSAGLQHQHVAERRPGPGRRASAGRAGSPRASSETRSASSGVITPTVPAGPGPMPVLQRQEAGEGQHRAGERQPGQRQPPARRRRQDEAAAEDQADERRRRRAVEHAEAHRRQQRQAAGAVAARRQAADRRQQHRGDGERRGRARRARRRSAAAISGQKISATPASPSTPPTTKRPPTATPNSSGRAEPGRAAARPSSRPRPAPRHEALGVVDADVGHAVEKRALQRQRGVVRASGKRSRSPRQRAKATTLPPAMVKRTATPNSGARSESW